MVTRRSLAGLVAGAALAPALARAQAWTPRRTETFAEAFPTAGRRPWAEQVPTLRVGLLGGENEADRMGRFGPYRELLERTFGVPTRLFPASDYAGVLQAFSAKQIEVAALGPSGYAGAWLDTNGGVEPLLTAEESDGSISYVAVMVVRADSGITSLEQMRGKSLAWADPNSTSGYLIPRFALRRQGIAVDGSGYFSRTGFAGGHEQGVVAVLQRQYDGAVTWASGQGDVNQGFSRGNLRAMVDKGMLNMRDLRIIWTSEPIVNGPHAARTELPAAFKEDWKRFHLTLPKAHPEIYRQVERGSGTGYREVRHEDYELIVEIRREEMAARRRRS
ncbi:phosphate/phosphite/phosphonate ABC transporter substrate-binding protein [Roseomonas sp. PWR1]|uniref:Phosphate/phosphite/phosphonate ABC transporter substrate-binding protein n=1 Tax=Roseomonas nitratireducens TaxID=2820810 RepID=A0ABS4ANW1_9PROT|nr:phosphate/phosphite/phosphonate ABC transporter substrate-binding protein [Neoroseomonas nitratireducens]MBP0462538.1 phosphate/phosphite/phosphonate ABC transporter substrate-binding protein [Neoroseomonas nitratireducens]